MLSDLSTHLHREQQKEEDLGDAYNIYAQLQRVLREADVQDNYDVLICDPPATESDHLYNAIYATRNLVIPIEPSAKGQASVEGLEALATNFADQLNIDVGVLAAIPVGFKGTVDRQEMLNEISFPTPEVIGDRTALMEGCWKQQCSAFAYQQEYRNYPREHEVETLEQLDRIARNLEEQVGLKAPSPPEPGELETLTGGRMTGFKDGASTDDPLGNDDEQDESTASISDSVIDTSGQPLSAETETASADTGLPWIYERSSITDGREKTVQLHLQDSTVDQQREVKTDVETLLDESVKKADLREAALLVGFQHSEEIAAKLREWGYDY